MGGIVLSAIDMAAVFITAALAGTGVGGGGLLVIYLTMVAGYSQTNAQAVNLLFFIAAALAALPYHAGKRKINKRAVFLCSALGIIGAIFGGALRDLLDPSAIRKIFGIMLIITGTGTLFKRKREETLFKITEDAY